MATTNETVILDLKVDQGSAISELERTKKSIIGVKEEQQELTKAYKAGNVTLDEYAAESVRLEAILKKNQAEYNNIQKSVTGVKTQMDKLIDSNKKISQEFQNAASNIRVAGVSVGDLTTKLASFANPATAAIGLATGLAAAYARSTIGARDLEFAQNQLSAAVTIVTDSFARLVSSGEDGEGIFSRLTSSILNQINPALGAMADASARAIENLEDVQRKAALVQSEVNQRLAENADLRTDIANTELSAADRLNAAQKVLDNITQNTNDKLASINALIDARKKVIEDSEKKEDAINMLIAERSALQAAESRDKSKIDKQINAIVKAEKERTEEIRKQQVIQENRINRPLREGEGEGLKTDEVPNLPIVSEDELKDSINGRVDQLDDWLKTSNEMQAKAREENRIKEFEDQQTRLMAQSMYFNAAATLAATFFGEGSAAYKALRISQAIIDTYSGATAALAPPPVGLGPILGPALAALTIATGLANVATITQAAGGGDFVTKGPTLMIVGDNPGGRERISVEPLSGRGKTRVGRGMIAMAGGGTLTTGFDDGGITKNGAVSSMQQTLMTINALKNLPEPVVSVKEISKVQKRLRQKVSVSEV